MSKPKVFLFEDYMFNSLKDMCGMLPPGNVQHFVEELWTMSYNSQKDVLIGINAKKETAIFLTLSKFKQLESSTNNGSKID